jgi:hypothetical protein
MKANQKIKSLRNDNSGYTKIIGGLVALLLTIIVGVKNNGTRRCLNYILVSSYFGKYQTA